MAKERIDKLMVARGLAPSRERAQAYLMAGRVLVDDQPIAKPGTQVDLEAEIRLKGEDPPFVGRGGLKLAGALKDFGINPQGWLCLDVGASTGGFTDCLLQAGAAFVYAVDAGTNQLDHRLRQDRRVLSLEKTNFRHADLNLTGSFVDFAVVDVSFISLTLILAPLKALLVKGGQVVALVKPQFEVGKGGIEKGGVVRDPKLREAAIVGVIEAAQSLGLVFKGRIDSPIEGKKSGNLEALIWLEKP
ncbi:MAG: TlyA family RNA methyltransferase [bacterium]|nr:TlyA family RNA methyltransferase [bacterium]